jgi:AcrR family transcriptional regulator
MSRPEPAGAGTRTGRRPAAGRTADEAASTKDRILDVALDLFVEHGFDGTSVRQIAEHVGITKAALYYYFASKDEILMALHMRLHESGWEAVRTIGDEPMTLEVWGALLSGLMDQITAQRKIFLLHERNQAAFEKLHRDQAHADAHEDLQTRFRAVLADSRVPFRDRVRMAGAFGVVFTGLFLSGEAFAAVSNAELRAALADAVQDVLLGGARDAGRGAAPGGA